MDDVMIPIDVDDAEFILDFEEWGGNATTTTRKFKVEKTQEIPAELLLILRKQCSEDDEESI
jgi:hypothetical protein